MSYKQSALFNAINSVSQARIDNKQMGDWYFRAPVQDNLWRGGIPKPLYEQQKMQRLADNMAKYPDSYDDLGNYIEPMDRENYIPYPEKGYGEGKYSKANKELEELIAKEMQKENSMLSDIRKGNKRSLGDLTRYKQPEQTIEVSPKKMLFGSEESRGGLQRVIDALRVPLGVVMNPMVEAFEQEKQPNRVERKMNKYGNFIGADFDAYRQQNIEDFKGALRASARALKGLNIFAKQVDDDDLKSTTNLLDSIGWKAEEGVQLTKPSTWSAKNTARFATTLAGDIFLDPLSYINYSATGATSDLMRGTGSKIGKQSVLPTSPEMAEEVLSKAGRQIHSENVAKIIKDLDKAKGLRPSRTVNFKVPFASKETAKPLFDTRVVQELGDKTISPVVNSILDALTLPGKTKKSTLAKNADKLFDVGVRSAVRSNIPEFRFTANQQNTLAQRMASEFDLSAEEQKQVLDVLSNPGQIIHGRNIMQTDKGKYIKDYLNDVMNDLIDGRLDPNDLLETDKVLKNKGTFGQIDMFGNVDTSIFDKTKDVIQDLPQANQPVPQVKGQYSLLDRIDKQLQNKQISMFGSDKIGVEDITYPKITPLTNLDEPSTHSLIEKVLDKPKGKQISMFGSDKIGLDNIKYPDISLRGKYKPGTFSKENMGEMIGSLNREEVGKALQGLSTEDQIRFLNENVFLEDKISPLTSKFNMDRLIKNFSNPHSPAESSLNYMFNAPERFDGTALDVDNFLAQKYGPLSDLKRGAEYYKSGKKQFAKDYDKFVDRNRELKLLRSMDKPSRLRHILGEEGANLNKEISSIDLSDFVDPNAKNFDIDEAYRFAKERSRDTDFLGKADQFRTAEQRKAFLDAGGQDSWYGGDDFNILDKFKRTQDLGVGATKEQVKPLSGQYSLLSRIDEQLAKGKGLDQNVGSNFDVFNKHTKIGNPLEQTSLFKAMDDQFVKGKGITPSKELKANHPNLYSLIKDKDYNVLNKHYDKKVSDGINKVKDVIGNKESDYSKQVNKVQRILNEGYNENDINQKIRLKVSEILSATGSSTPDDFAELKNDIMGLEFLTNMTSDIIGKDMTENLLRMHNPIYDSQGNKVSDKVADFSADLIKKFSDTGKIKSKLKGTSKNSWFRDMFTPLLTESGRNAIYDGKISTDDLVSDVGIFIDESGGLFDSVTTQKITKTISEVNKTMKDKYGIDKFINDDIGEIYVNHMQSRNKMMYQEKSIANMVESFGRTVKNKIAPKLGKNETAFIQSSDLMSVLSRHDDKMRQSILEDLGLNNVLKDGYVMPMVEVRPENLEKVANLFGNGKLHVLDKDVFKTASKHGLTQQIRDSNVFLDIYDKALNWYKVMTTSASPGFHARNKIGNMAQSYVNIGTEALDPKNMKVANDIMTKKVGSIDLPNGTMSYDDIRDAMGAYGLLDSGFFRTEFSGAINNESKSKKVNEIINIFDTKNHFYLKNMSKLGDKIESGDKVVNFVANLKNGFSVEESAEMVNKYLFDYSDITDFEKNVMRRIQPFYTWISKNVPLQYEILRDNPNYHRGLFKVLGAMDDQIPDSEKVDRRFINDFAKNWVQLPGTVTSPDGVEEPIMFNPNLPYDDLDRLLGLLNPKEEMREIASRTTPALRIPYELATNKQIYFDQPIKAEDYDNSKRQHGLVQLSKDFIRMAQGQEPKQERIDPRLRYMHDQIPAWKNLGGFFEKSGADRVMHGLNHLGGLKFMSYDAERAKYFKMREMLEKMRSGK